MKTNPNDPAFANLCQLSKIGPEGIEKASLPPLTKREYFAALALQGLLANPSIILKDSEPYLEAVAQADALIEALNNKEEL